MVQYQVKLRLNSTQEGTLDAWLLHLTSVWNWAVRKIELDAKDGIYHSRMDFQNLLAGHGEKMGIPSHTLQGILSTAHTAWSRCFKKLARRPRLKGRRRPLNNVPFPDPIRPPEGHRIKVPGLGVLRFHQQSLPEGRIKCGRIVRRASGWYLCLCLDAEPKTIARVSCGTVGIDPGFHDLLTLSTGEKIAHPREWEQAEKRLAQAQRGQHRALSARMQERIANRRKDRNHKLSRRLVSEHTLIAWSQDDHRGIASRFGRSVASSGHAQLRRQLAYKSLLGGAEFVEVSPTNSTRTCSSCGALTGPAGLAGLSVRQWRCGGCGTLHDRDVNAARNTLLVGAGIAHEGAA